MGQKRLPKTTRKQYVELLNFVENNTILLKSKYGPRETHNVDMLWKQFETHINTLGIGPTKTARQWRKIWCEWKANTRRRLRLLHKPEEGKTDVRELAHVEDRLLELLGDSRIKNDSNEKSSNFQTIDALEIKSENLSTSFLGEIVEYSKDEHSSNHSFDPSEASCNSSDSLNMRGGLKGLAKLKERLLNESMVQNKQNMQLNFVAIKDLKMPPDQISKVNLPIAKGSENNSYNYPTIVPFSEFSVVSDNSELLSKVCKQKTNYRKIKRLKCIERAKKYKKLQIRQYKASLEIAKSLKTLNESVKQLAEASMVRAKAEMLKVEAMNLKAQVNILKYTNKFD